MPRHRVRQALHPNPVRTLNVSRAMAEEAEDHNPRKRARQGGDHTVDGMTLTHLLKDSPHEKDEEVKRLRNVVSKLKQNSQQLVEVTGENIKAERDRFNKQLARVVAQYRKKLDNTECVHEREMKKISSERDNAMEVQDSLRELLNTEKKEQKRLRLDVGEKLARKNPHIRRRLSTFRFDKKSKGGVFTFDDQDETEENALRRAQSSDDELVMWFRGRMLWEGSASHESMGKSAYRMGLVQRQKLDESGKQNQEDTQGQAPPVQSAMECKEEQATLMSKLGKELEEEDRNLGEHCGNRLDHLPNPNESIRDQMSGPMFMYLERVYATAGPYHSFIMPKNLPITEVETCSICMETFGSEENPEDVGTFSQNYLCKVSCGHVYHYGCYSRYCMASQELSSWLVGKRLFCPLCKQVVYQGATSHMLR